MSPQVSLPSPARFAVHRTLIGRLLCLLMLLEVFAPRAAQADELVRWSQAWLRTADSGPSVVIHDSGRVEIHRPRFFQSPGDFELRLTPEELAEWRLAIALLEGFEEEPIRRHLEDRKLQRVEDSQEVLIGAGGAVSRFLTATQEIHWRSPSVDAELLSGADAAQVERLGRLEKHLLQLLEDPRRRAVELHPPEVP